MMEAAYHLVDHAMLHSRNRGKCTRIHANLGRGVDGCQLFDGETNPHGVHCGACGCHMEFHVNLNHHDRRVKRCKRSPSPAESVGDNLDSPGLGEITSGYDLARILTSSETRDESTRVNTRNYMTTPLFFKLSSKLRLIQEEYLEDIHGKFSIVYDEDHGYRVHCGGCNKRYGLVKPGFSLGNFERGHLACRRHKELQRVKAVQSSMKELLQQTEAKHMLKTFHCR